MQNKYVGKYETLFNLRLNNLKKIVQQSEIDYSMPSF